MGLNETGVSTRETRTTETEPVAGVQPSLEPTNADGRIVLDVDSEFGTSG